MRIITRAAIRTPRSRRGWVLGAVAVLGAPAAIATATIQSGTSAQTLARGATEERVKINTKSRDEHIKIRSSGPVEHAVQRVEIAPGGTAGWHSHPGPHFITVTQGALTLYFADCAPQRYGPAVGRTTLVAPGPDVHTARNEGTEPLVFYVTYIVPAGVGPLREDEPRPAGCNKD